MMEMPTWMLTSVWGLIAVLLATIGYLIRFVISTNQRKNDEQDVRISALEKKLSEADRRFVQAELDSVKQFVDRETWTRDYVTLTNRLDAAFKKLDRLTEKRPIDD